MTQQELKTKWTSVGEFCTHITEELKKIAADPNVRRGVREKLANVSSENFLFAPDSPWEKKNILDATTCVNEFHFPMYTMKKEMICVDVDNVIHKCNVFLLDRDYQKKCWQIKHPNSNKEMPLKFAGAEASMQKEVFVEHKCYKLETTNYPKTTQAEFAEVLIPAINAMLQLDFTEFLWYYGMDALGIYPGEEYVKLAAEQFDSEHTTFLRVGASSQKFSILQSHSVCVFLAYALMKVGWSVMYCPVGYVISNNVYEWKQAGMQLTDDNICNFDLQFVCFPATRYNKIL